MYSDPLNLRNKVHGVYMYLELFYVHVLRLFLTINANKRYCIHDYFHNKMTNMSHKKSITDNIIDTFVSTFRNISSGIT